MILRGLGILEDRGFLGPDPKVPRALKRLCRKQSPALMMVCEAFTLHELTYNAPQSGKRLASELLALLEDKETYSLGGGI